MNNLTTNDLLDKIYFLSKAGLSNTAAAQVLNDELGDRLQSVIDEYIVTWDLYTTASKELAYNHTANNVERELIYRKKGIKLADEIETITGQREREVLTDIL